VTIKKSLARQSFIDENLACLAKGPLCKQHQASKSIAVSGKRERAGGVGVFLQRLKIEGQRLDRFLGSRPVDRRVWRVPKTSRTKPRFNSRN